MPRGFLKHIILIQSALRKLNQEILLFSLIENLKVRSLIEKELLNIERCLRNIERYLRNIERYLRNIERYLRNIETISQNG